MNNTNTNTNNATLYFARYIIEKHIIEIIDSDIRYREIWDMPANEKVYVWAYYSENHSKEEYCLINAYYNLNKIIG